jgi:hypothetical protein
VGGGGDRGVDLNKDAFCILTLDGNGRSSPCLDWIELHPGRIATLLINYPPPFINKYNSFHICSILSFHELTVLYIFNTVLYLFFTVLSTVQI